MNWDAVTAVAEVAGLIAVVVSLIYVGFQVRQNTQQLKHDNLRQSVRGTLDANWFYHRDDRAFEVFKNGVQSFESLSARDKALFHSIIVDLAFYFEIVRNMEEAGLVDKSAVEINQRFLVGILATPGGTQWLRLAEETQPMPPAALDYLKHALSDAGPHAPLITELQPWFESTGGVAEEKP